MITQSAVTIVAPVTAGHEQPLQELLESAGQDPANNSVVPFARFPNVHFARFFILPSSTDPQGISYPTYLVFLADVDGPAEAFVLQFIGGVGEGLDAIYQHCAEYAGRAALREYLQAHCVNAAASYVNTVGRTVTQVRQEAQLHDAIESFLDSAENLTVGRKPPRVVRALIQEFVEQDPALAWAVQTPAQTPGAGYVAGETLQLALVGAAGIIFSRPSLPRCRSISPCCAGMKCTT